MAHSTDPELNAALDADAAALKALGLDPGPTLDEFYDFAPDAECWKCVTCKGSGTINALTNPDWAPFVASYGECPSCDGTGEAP